MDDSEDGAGDPIHLSPIEQLPRELAWKIIEYAPESVFNLKLVSQLTILFLNGLMKLVQASPMLNLRVNEFALERETIPLIESLEFDGAPTAVESEVRICDKY